MKLKLYQIDAFASQAFEGNPAAVVPLKTWLSDDLMQSIAAENNLSETAFFVPQDHGFAIRWFTPNTEVKLCGHATLATAFVIYECQAYAHDSISFNSLSGVLTVTRTSESLVLDFPVQPPVPCEIPEPIQEIFGSAIQTCLKAEDYIVVLNHEDDVLAAKPDLNILKQLGLRGVIITAASQQYDFVSRFFAPNFGINEDPVTGSSFTQLAPYWASVLGKPKMHAKQVSLRGGKVSCELCGKRVKIAGQAIKYLEGMIEV